MGIVIGLDIDGVVANSFPVFRDELNKYYGKEISEIDNYNMAELYGVAWDDLGAFFQEHVEYLYSAPKPMEGALEIIREWLEEGHEIIYVTARKKGIEEEVTKRWFDQFGLNKQKAVFMSGLSKTFAVKEYGIEAFVDDFPVNALEVAALEVPVLLFDAPYNQGKLSKGVTRCYNWAEVKEQMTGIASGIKALRQKL